MSSGLEKLREIGAQKIFEQTHITKEHVQAILHKSFEGLTRVQFQGFISILEREYQVSLKEVRDAASEFYKQYDDPFVKKEDKGVFVKPEKDKKTITPYIIFIVLLVVAAVLYFRFDNSSVVVSKVDNTLIDSVKEKVEKKAEVVEKQQEVPQDIEIVDELNTTTKQDDANVTESEITLEPTIQNEQEIVLKSLKIIPRSKLWVGYIDVETNKHYETVVVKDIVELDTSKEWLIVLGHSYVNIELDGEKKEFNGSSSLRFLYQDSKLKAIGLNEFKALNKGKKW